VLERAHEALRVGIGVGRLKRGLYHANPGFFQALTNRQAPLPSRSQISTVTDQPPAGAGHAAARGGLDSPPRGTPRPPAVDGSANRPAPQEESAQKRGRPRWESIITDWDADSDLARPSCGTLRRPSFAEYSLGVVEEFGSNDAEVFDCFTRTKPRSHLGSRRHWSVSSSKTNAGTSRSPSRLR
jgi:hypothetical protein